MTTRTMGTTAGGAFVWLFVSLCLCASAYASLDFLADPRYRDPASIWILEGSMLFACAGLWAQAKRNLYQVSLYLLVVSSMAALGSGAIVVFASAWRPGAAMVCVVATALAMGCLLQVSRSEGAQPRPRLSWAG